MNVYLYFCCTCLGICLGLCVPAFITWREEKQARKTRGKHEML